MFEPRKTLTSDEVMFNAVALFTAAKEWEANGMKNISEPIMASGVVLANMASMVKQIEDIQDFLSIPDGNDRNDDKPFPPRFTLN